MVRIHPGPSPLPPIWRPAPRGQRLPPEGLHKERRIGFHHDDRGKIYDERGKNDDERGKNDDERRRHPRLVIARAIAQALSSAL